MPVARGRAACLACQHIHALVHLPASRNCSTLRAWHLSGVYLISTSTTTNMQAARAPQRQRAPGATRRCVPQPPPHGQSCRRPARRNPVAAASAAYAGQPEAHTADVVVIGAGIGGLSCAAMLAKYGLTVTVLESHSIPGGAAHVRSPSSLEVLHTCAPPQPSPVSMCTLCAELPCFCLANSVGPCTHHLCCLETAPGGAWLPDNVTSVTWKQTDCFVSRPCQFGRAPPPLVALGCPTCVHTAFFGSLKLPRP